MSIKNSWKKFLGTAPDETQLRGLHLAAGAKHYRAFVGPPDRYDLMALLEFRILTDLGMREAHHVLDLGCGSLRLGRLLIPFLLPDRYVGIEPESWLVDAGFEHELGEAIRQIKAPAFCADRECPLDHFHRSFDFIMIQSVFSHAPLDWIERCAARLSKVLAQSAGIVIANFQEGADDYAEKQWLYPACSKYRRPTLEALFAAAGLIWRPLDYPHPGDLRWFTLSR
jgi:SAM-dependent methyltransferase